MRGDASSDPIIEGASVIARSGDFMAHWTPAHANPVTAAVVVSWFRDEFKKGPWPDEVAVRSLVRWLNVAGPYDTDNITRLTTLPPEYVELSKAITTILAVSPGILEIHEKRSKETTGNKFQNRMNREWHDKRTCVLRALLLGARAAAIEFPTHSKGGKKKSPPWKMVAQTAASFIAAALLQAGHQSPNFNGGPATEVLRRAMEHVEGKARKPNQLREAFR